MLYLVDALTGEVLVESSDPYAITSAIVRSYYRRPLSHFKVTTECDSYSAMAFIETYPLYERDPG